MRLYLRQRISYEQRKSSSEPLAENGWNFFDSSIDTDYSPWCRLRVIDVITASWVKYRRYTVSNSV
ncbi:unnamed protein product [Ceratitis capitata]|uniref:(Mediterranean fruit fly) hypothetical protein n=1 Tax=Ceratitis capitata TaxID=7213 RepID=A0A811TY62_CERCA|nr:unnamed protein product [Ceratitis capitata]